MTGRFGIAMAGMALLTGLSGCRNVESHVETPVPENTTAVAEVPGKRLLYPWSVVAGGVDSPAAMGEAMSADPVVALHYAGLRPGEFRTERLPVPRQGHVSYRIADKIYWTRGAVTLTAGETVLTDGLTVVRGRCGNLFSPVAREPVAPAGIEPPEPLLDEPVQIGSLLLPPAAPANAIVETEKFQNPLVRAENPDENSVLPIPQMSDALPPVWVTGGGAGSAGGGWMGVGGSGTTAPTASAPPTSGLAVEPGTPEPSTPISTAVATGPAPVPIEAAPPMVLVSLLIPPSSQGTWAIPFLPGPAVETWIAPEVSGVLVPQAPQILAPPIVPPTVPPTDSQLPRTFPPYEPPPIVSPPSISPPVLPDIPPDVSIPEPGAWVLALIGLLAIAIGSIRRK